MSRDARDTLDRVWEAMHGDRAYADRICYAICQWAGCDECVVEQDGEVWVSGPDPRHIYAVEAVDLVRYLQKLGLIGEVV